MADKITRITPAGNMDKDSDPRYVGKGERAGDYLDARNIQAVSEDGNLQGSAIPTKGCVLGFDLGSVTQQNKRYRIFLDGDATKQHAVRFLSTQRDANILIGTGPLPGQAVEFNGTVASCVAALQAAGNAGVMTFSATATTVDVTMTAYPMYQWYAESVGQDVVQVTCVAEAIPVDLAGPLKDIGSYDLLGDLFIFSTTQDNEPTEIAPDIILVGPTSGGTYIGPLTSLLFNGNHGLVQGQWIRITGSNESFLNGLFVVNSVVDATQIEIVTVTAWGVSPPVTTLGTPQVFIHPTGIGEIGVAQKDDNTDSWTYTRLLRSVELNFVSRWQVDSDGEKEVNEVSIYFDDDYNNYRRIYYKGDYVTDGLLGFIGAGNDYSYGNINSQIYGFSPKPYVIIDYDGQSNPGGSLVSGNYRYFFVFKDFSGNESNPSDLSGVVVVYSDEENSLAIGDDAGVTTNKLTRLTVSGIDTSVFSQVALGYVNNTLGVLSANIGPFREVSGVEMSFVHTGFEEFIPYDVAVFASQWNSLNYDFAKNIRIIDQRIVRSNLRKPRYADLEDFFASFKHSVCVERIDGTQAPSASNPAGEFKDTSNVFYKKGYMFNETYRFSGRVVFNNGSISDWFWIDDIRIDPLTSNAANPNDDRRDQSSPNIATSYDLTENIPGIAISQTGRKTPDGSVFDSNGNLVSNPQNGVGDYFSDSRYFHKTVLVPYVEFFGANINAPINGTPLSSLISHIEIGRCEVVKEVIATGMAVSSVRITTSDDLNVPGEDFQSVQGILRGPSLVGTFSIINQGSNRLPDTRLGLGVRTGDRDGVFETFHEYPYVYSSFPMTRMVTGSTPASSALPFITTHLLEHFVVTFQPEGSWVNTFQGFNDGSTPPGVSVYYPSANGVDFCMNDIPTTEEDSIGTSTTLNNFGNRLKSERRYHTIYSPDLIFGQQQEFEPSTISSVIDFGEAFLDMTQFSNTFYWKAVSTGSEDVQIPSCVSRYIPENMGTSFNEYTIDRISIIGAGERVNMDGFNGFRKAHDAFSFFAGQFIGGPPPTTRKIGYEGLWKMIESPVVFTENNGLGIVSQGKNPDHGIRYIQLFTKKDDKYGDKSESTYLTTNTVLDIREREPFGDIQPGEIKVFGGDTYTQQSYLKTKFSDVSVSPGANDGEWSTDDTLMSATKGPGFGGGLFVYTQNRVNSQLRFDTEDQFIPLKDTNTLGEWAWDFRLLDRHTYSGIYDGDVSDGLTQASGNEGLDPTRFDFPSRIVWSQKKIYGELSDSYAMFLPFDLKDLDLRFGEIMHHENVNGELFTLQLRKWMAQLFNTRGELQVSGNAIGAVIGDGSVLSRDGQTLSRYGTENKWSCVLGTSQGGKDVLYWFNAENGLFLRFGADGTVIISDTRRFRSFSNKAAKWVRGKDAPAFEQGIRAVWDDRSKEAIWTFTGWRDVAEWARPGVIIPSTTEGTVVSNPNAPSLTYENLPRFFKAKSTHANLLSREPGVGADWQEFFEEIPVTDTDYYSVFTVAHNEMTNGFKTFYGHIPKTYLKWRDTFLSSHPIFRNLIFEHRKGDYCTWYGNEAKGIAPKIEDAHVEMVVNELPEQSMRGVAVSFLSDNAPDRVDFSTPRQRTFSESQDFVRRDDQYFAPIRGDVSQGLAPNQSRVALSGDYLRVKFTIFGGTYNLLHSIIVKIRDRMRRINN
jgi:hypothetical protein